MLLVVGRSQTLPAWKQVWADNFNGPADGSVNTRYWEFNTGRCVFGTGEIETMTSSPYNAHLDGHGNLDLTVLVHGAAGTSGAAWASARIRTKPQFAAPAGGEMMVTASIEQPDPANPLGYWPGSGCWGRACGPRSAKSTSWRMSTASARPQAPRTAGT